MRKLIQPIVASVAGAASASTLAEPTRADKPMKRDQGVVRDPAAEIPVLTVVSRRARAAAPMPRATGLRSRTGNSSRRFPGPLGSKTFFGNMNAA